MVLADRGELQLAAHTGAASGQRAEAATGRQVARIRRLALKRRVIRAAANAREAESRSAYGRRENPAVIISTMRPVSRQRGRMMRTTEIVRDEDA
jgi:hypothetical protein